MSEEEERASALFGGAHARPRRLSGKVTFEQAMKWASGLNEAAETRRNSFKQESEAAAQVEPPREEPGSLSPVKSGSEATEDSDPARQLDKGATVLDEEVSRPENSSNHSALPQPNSWPRPATQNQGELSDRQPADSKAQPEVASPHGHFMAQEPASLGRQNSLSSSSRQRRNHQKAIISKFVAEMDKNNDGWIAREDLITFLRRPVAVTRPPAPCR
jgi:hypothetical protein